MGREFKAIQKEYKRMNMSIEPDEMTPPNMSFPYDDNLDRQFAYLENTSYQLVESDDYLYLADQNFIFDDINHDL